MQAPNIGHEKTWMPAIQNAFVQEAGGVPHESSYGERYVHDDVKRMVQERAAIQISYMKEAKRPWGVVNSLQKRTLTTSYTGHKRVLHVDDPFYHPKYPLLVS